MKLKAATSSVSAGTALSLSGTVKHPRAGASSVDILMQTGSQWWRLASTKLSAKRTFSVPVVLTTTGTCRLVAQYRAGSTRVRSNVVAISVTAAQPSAFNFTRELLGSARSLSAWVQSTDPLQGTVTINGSDTRRPTTPFSFAWGDGATSEGFFPQAHTYADPSRTYRVTATAHYPAGGSDSVDVTARFAPPSITPVPYPASLAVTIPSSPVTLGTRQPAYTPPALTAFGDASFPAIHPRATQEYVFSQAARVQDAILAGDHELVDGAFRQVVLRDAGFNGAYSLWFTSPVALASGDVFFSGSIGYASVFHELGHNFSLNAPAAFRYGGRIDGNANAIFSESVAQMFQHATAFELVNHATAYGLPADLASEIGDSARAGVNTVRSAYDDYVARGKPFTTWNDPGTAVDETFGTFMTVAYQFCIHAEAIQDYAGPLKRTMTLLRAFDEDTLARYAPSSDTPAASVFRSTLMIAALSYGFSQDLRADFRALGFPVDDAVFQSLYGSVP